MPIPKTRDELTELVSTTFAKLCAELDSEGPKLGALPCIDGWTVKDLLAVRLWWSERVVDWVEAGRCGEIPHIPAKGYSWKETPRLNADVVQASHKQSYRTIRSRLDRAVHRVLVTIDDLDDVELLNVGVFEWAGRWPVSRWISLNTARQYATARTFIRQALRRRRKA